MKKLLIIVGLVALFSNGISAQELGKAPLVLEVGGGANYSFQTDFAGAELSYSGILSLSYRIGPDTMLGITLLRFNGYWLSDGPLSTFSYGFNYKHYLPKSWGGDGPLQPYFSYSILLNQAVLWGTKGRGIAHDSRIGLGLDFKLDGPHKLYLEMVGDVVEFPSLGVDTKQKLNSGGIYMGYKYFF